MLWQHPWQPSDSLQVFAPMLIRVRLSGIQIAESR